MSIYRGKILKEASKYYRELNGDFSHDINHFLRIERLAKKIGTNEGADLEILEASALLFDVARMMEAKGEVEDHAEAGSKIARATLNKVGFPKKKIESVCHAILVHRKSMNKEPETLEAKILQDADYLDALGAIDITRIIGSSFQSKKYKRPIYDGLPSNSLENNNKSAINYLLFKIAHPKMQPERFHTKLGRAYARDRYDILPAQRAGFPSLKKDDISAFNSSSGIARGLLECCYKFIKEFARRFIAEWEGKG